MAEDNNLTLSLLLMISLLLILLGLQISLALHFLGNKIIEAAKIVSGHS
jgi:hypothetical protein